MTPRRCSRSSEPSSRSPNLAFSKSGSRGRPDLSAQDAPRDRGRNTEEGRSQRSRSTRRSTPRSSRSRAVGDGDDPQTLSPACNCGLCAGPASEVGAVWLADQQRPQLSSLRIIVKDPSGAVVPGAMVQVKGAEDRTAAVSLSDLPSDGQGVVVANALQPGRYSVQVSFPGFETLVMPDVRVRTGENKRDAVLAIQKLDESVSVGRDKATVASDPNNDRFSTVLTKAQIDALPDDPDEMEPSSKRWPARRDAARGRSAAASCRPNRRSARSGSRGHVCGRESRRRHGVPTWSAAGGAACAGAWTSCPR